ncbi:glycosyltransferase [Arundinibacter roseus]|uniref:Glycosyltransferase family 1 protein n=1 Tax=Arundinibacter roseus TaxID=2070510 RepID=A0A4V2XA47_9BACT|nr:glycosyltransferase [Arundinibacter roseus]TDB65975.1 glycosyltransferase family 1 protein [Arundinibacter roseus]
MDLFGQNILILSLFRYDADIESTSMAIARELAKANKVYYFDNPYTINDVIKKRKTECFKKRRGFFSVFSDQPIQTLENDLEIFVSPILLSLNFLPEGPLYRFLLRINEWLMRTKIRHILKKREVKDFVYINSFNFHYPGISENLTPKLRIYHCLDPVFGPFDGRHGVPSENQLVHQSDLVICSSRQLYHEKLQLNPRTFFVPNAADLDHSRQAQDPQQSVSPMLSSFSRPIIGYIGSIDYRMDFSLLENVARLHPDKCFVFIGPVNCELPDEMLLTPNIYFPGKIAYSELPAVLKGFDVAIIPFKKDERSATVFPLKLFEYLGAGKPVVLSDFNPDLQEFTKKSAAIAQDVATFAEAIQEALSTNTPALEEERIQLASQNTWKHRGETIANLLAEAIQEKSVSVVLKGTPVA